MQPQQQQTVSAEQYQAPPPQQTVSAEQCQAPPPQYQQQQQAPPPQYQQQQQAPPQQQQYDYAQGSDDVHRICGTPAELMALILSIIVLILSGGWCIYSGAGSTVIGFGFGTGISFFSGILVIIAYCLAHCGCQVNLIVLIWLYFIALIINAIAILVNAIMLIWGAIWLSALNSTVGYFTGGMSTAILVIFIIFFLLYLALICFYGYVIWLAYKDVKRTPGFLPNYVTGQTTGGTGVVVVVADPAPAPVVVVQAPPPRPAPMVVVQAPPPSSDGALKPPPPTTGSVEATGSK